MLEKITLKNFRQFEDRTVDFGAGNVSLRGPNEAGKTTVVEAFMYAIGGARQCRNSDFVRWGSKASQCKVEVLMNLQGLPVRVKRGPSGAEIYAPASAETPHVTGQNEVSAWFAEQLGASMDVASKMMFAGQKEIGGLLDEKNGKVVEFIEAMSGLDIVEWLIDQVKAGGRVGSTDALEQAVEDARAAVAQLGTEDFDALLKTFNQQLPQLNQEVSLVRACITDNNANIEATHALLRAHTVYAQAVGQARAAVAARSEALTESREAYDAAAAANAGAPNVGDLQAEINTKNDEVVAQVKLLRDGQDSEERAIDAATEAEVIKITQAAAKTTVDINNQIADLDLDVARVKLHQRLAAYALPDAEWEGNRASLDTFIADQTAAEARIAGELADLRGAQRAKELEAKNHRSQAEKLRASVVALGQKCPTCHQTIPDAEGVEAHNQQLRQEAGAHDLDAAKLDAEIVALGEKIDVLVAEGTEAQGNLLEARKIAASRGFVLDNAEQADWVSFDESFVPARPSWIGDAPMDRSQQIAALRTSLATAESESARQIESLRDDAARRKHDIFKRTRSAADELEAGRRVYVQERDVKIREADRLRDRLHDAQKALELAESRHGVAVDDLNERLADGPPDGEPAQLEKRLVDQRDAAEKFQAEEREASMQLAVLKTNIEHAEANRRRQLDEKAAAEGQLAQAVKSLQEVVFNNSLVSALTKARPQLANQLWNMVLKGVSTYLTQMRREPSIVERDGKTFLINGKPYDSYSGSALDLLALGIRIALTKVFVPGANMMILDEPFAACSEERTMQCLSLITAAGFGQMLVITHESQSEAVFDKVVEV